MTTATKHQAKADIVVLPRRDAWFALRELHGLTSDKALAAALGVAETTTYRVFSGAVLPSATFIGRALVAFPTASFAGLFAVVKR